MGYYEKNAKEYIEKTFNANMDNSYDIFIKHIPKNSSILDLGCGSGRDSLYFQNNGYTVFAIDPVDAFVEHAKSLGIKNVINMRAQDILSLNQKFDGIWACASLLHLKKQEIREVIISCYSLLNDNGILYMSFKEGDFEGVRDERYYTDLTYESLKELVNEKQFSIKYTKNEDSLKRNNTWINFYLQKKK